MKTVRVLFAGLAVGLAGFGLAGCRNPEADKAGATTAVEKKAEEAKPAVPAAQQKPKDHPAH